MTHNYKKKMNNWDLHLIEAFMPDFPFAFLDDTLFENHWKKYHFTTLRAKLIMIHFGRFSTTVHELEASRIKLWFWHLNDGSSLTEAPSRHAFFVCYFLSSVHGAGASVARACFCSFPSFWVKWCVTKCIFIFPLLILHLFYCSKWKKLRNWTKKIYFKCQPDEIKQSSTRLLRWLLRFATLLE